MSSLIIGVITASIAQTNNPNKDIIKATTMTFPNIKTQTINMC